MTKKVKKQATLFDALLCVSVLVAVLVTCLVFLRKYEISAHIPLIIGATFASGVAVFRLGFNWKELEEGILSTINTTMQSILILLVVGMIIGTWIAGGIVPAMIYWGLKILSPGIFLVATTLICAIVSISTGSSWTTAGTVGIALLGIGSALGIPGKIVAGAIISGAYFGDKMSPLSDTTNLAPAMAGSTLFDHIKHMVYTAGPALLISLVLYGIIGMKYAGSEMDISQINQIQNALLSNYNTLSPFLLLVPCAVIAMVIFKVPTIPALIGGVILGGVCAVVFQGASIADILVVAKSGYVSSTGMKFVDDLLTRGGLDSMLGTVSLILCALTVGGVLEKTGMLQVIAQSILKFAKGTFGLIAATIFTCIGTNLAVADQYLAIVIPGSMYKDAFIRQGLSPKNLSRALEDSATITSPLIPWNTCGAYMSATLGIGSFVFLPYAFFNLICPLISLFYGLTGLTIEKLSDEDLIEEFENGIA
ncbi:Na+/H+ antiporter NhaC [Romboutsia sp. 1001216sp1]|uniref:Na+/H+ antiporter NhaC n=1 Tax=Romboutsia TaxID=1501226 RepID=UPI000AC3D224|nr:MULTISPECIES: Na+/H+ antiporter NhaC [Romboutsia]MDB8790933.1 Na+/H+ antiporter NhaC [Romboutsia sp. 1001216sp1]MDB8793653.1 Na+/H+ antiporter NhaC [Romboutsia sp. 1001216sp1]MDB8795050.1 Na+/H+ antiporter NhaC [Romboutsia sp. 1001216sp1]MDB8798860.1 Na+/H+ antiporter NhaC [Romboutsia sp. 1001216sp1]MDB8801663.1 Na+/H+ antiporter NhaC [Romboutsia sp. 1001216sp1]